MQKDRGFRVLAILALVVAVAGLSIGYAALSRNLNINTTATLKASSWDVHFENLNKTVSGITDSDVTATLTSPTQIDVTANLKKPGDSVVFTFDVKNAGTIDAKLSAAPTITGDTTEAAANKVTWTLTDAAGNELIANDPLNVAGVKSLKLTIAFDSNAGDADLVTEDKPFSIAAVLNYVQA